jgi:hypothetical protein
MSGFGRAEKSAKVCLPGARKAATGRVQTLNAILTNELNFLAIGRLPGQD